MAVSAQPAMVKPSSGISTQLQRVVETVQPHALDAVEAEGGRHRAAASPGCCRGRAGRSNAGPAGRPERRATRPGSCFSFAGLVVLPSPSTFSISTTSRHSPNFQPQSLNTPTWLKPSARCTPIEPALAESPITAIIWRTPTASAASRQCGQQPGAEALARAHRRRGRSSPRPRSGRPGAA